MTFATVELRRLPDFRRLIVQREDNSRRRPSFFERLFKRRQASLYQRCLAVHIAGAGTISTLR